MMVSKRQNAAMHAAKEGHSTLGIPQSVGAEFVKASHGQDIKKLPQRVAKKAEGGAVDRPVRFRW